MSTPVFPVGGKEGRSHFHHVVPSSFLSLISLTSYNNSESWTFGPTLQMSPLGLQEDK